MSDAIYRLVPSRVSAHELKAGDLIAMRSDDTVAFAQCVRAHGTRVYGHGDKNAVRRALDSRRVYDTEKDVLVKELRSKLDTLALALDDTWGLDKETVGILQDWAKARGIG